VYFAGYVHYHCQHDKESDRPHKQRVILLPQSDVKKQVNARQSGADHECAHAASKEKAAIPRNQQRRCHRRDQVSPTESDKFRNRQQEQVKYTKRRPDHEVLKRMNFLARRNFEQKECCENEYEEEHAVFDGAFDVTIRIEDRQELRAKKGIGNRLRCETLVAAAACPRLRVIPTIIRDLPFCVEAVRANRSFCGEKRAAKSRVGPVRFQCRFVLHSKRSEENSIAAIEIQRNRELNLCSNRLITAELRCRSCCISSDLRAR